ncbi:MAG: hypothetical protein ONB06_12350 [candidate division KSB1 bacterium]|nr:hypothetical protein [candidate division KSB1 bacterium]
MNAAIDIQFPILLTLEEAALGTQRDFFYPSREMLCSRCGGAGQVESGACEVCEGFGRSYLPRKVTVAVPAGVNDQVRIRVSEQGLLAPDLTHWGDLYLVCYLRPHATFQREGFDLIVEVESNTGGKLTVPTLTGPIEVPLPDGEGDAPLRLPGLGLPRRIGGGERGDLVVKLKAASSAVSAEELPSRKAARQHLVEAIQREPLNPVHRYNLALVALREQNNLEAAVSLEVALKCGDSRPQTRQTLAQALTHLFNPMLVVFGDRALNERIHQSCHLAQHSMYVSAAKRM